MADDIETPEVSAPAEVVATPTPEAPVVETAPDPYAEYGGRDRVADAVAIASGFQTESGIKAIATSTLRSLGYTSEEVQSFFDREAAQVADPDPASQLADDDVITVADAKRMIAEGLKSAVTPLQQQAEARQAENAQQAVSTTLSTLGVESEAQQRLVLLAAQAYLDPADWEPSHIRAAIERGHADAVAMIQADHERYVASKGAAAAAQPTPLGQTGGSNGGAAEGPPASLEDAMLRVRKRLLSGNV